MNDSPLHFPTTNLFKCLILQCVGGLKALVNMAMNLPSGIHGCVFCEDIHWDVLKLLYLQMMLKILHSLVLMVERGEIM